MNKNETLRLSQSLAELARTYKEEWTDEKLRDIYHRILGDLLLDDVLAACSTWLCSDSPFFPKPGQLRTLALNLPSNPHSTEALRQRAEQAWQNLRGTTHAQAYNRWALADGVTAQVFQVMGSGYMTTTGFGQWETRYEEVKHREFVQTYLDLARQYTHLEPLPTQQESQRLNMPVVSSENVVSSEEAHAWIASILDTLEKSLSFPPLQPYKHGKQQRSYMPLDYTPSLSPTELEARKNLLRRQGHMIMAQELARKDK